MGNLEEMTYCSKKKCITLLVVYFGIFVFLLPALITKVTLLIDPEATIQNLPIMVVAYLVILIASLYLTKDIWLASIQQFKEQIAYNVQLVIWLSFLVLLANFMIGMIIMYITGLGDSANQQIISNNVLIAPAFTIFADCFIAPLLEETVFRAGLFSCLRKKHTFLMAAIISSLLFGSIHVLDSLMSGNYIDCIYLFLYAGIGMILAYAYEKTNSVCTSVAVHAMNNVVVTILMLVKLF